MAAPQQVRPTRAHSRRRHFVGGHIEIEACRQPRNAKARSIFQWDALVHAMDMRNGATVCAMMAPGVE